MRFISHRISLIFLILAVSFAAGYATTVNVKAGLDSAYLLMGKVTTLHLDVSQPKNLKGEFPILRQIRETGTAAVCGDSVELRLPVKGDTTESGNMLKIRYDVTVQAFDSGFYRLPELLYVAGKDTFPSNRLTLKVVPVMAEADTPINDFAGVSGPENPSIFDSLPDILYYSWWIILLILLAIAVFWYMVRRYKVEGSLLPKKPAPTPYEAAISALTKLKEQKLWEQGMEREYYTELTDILRKYLEGRFHINAMEMTSRQILHSLEKNPEIRDRKMEIRQILDMADFVKFAKVRPLPEDNVKSYDNALQFVKDTKPAPDPEKEKEKDMIVIPEKPTLKEALKNRRKGGEK